MGKRPLHAQAVPTSGLNKANAGLYFDKYCDQWTQTDTDWKVGDAKKDFLQATARLGCNADLLVETMIRRERLAEMQKGASFVLESRSSVVAGLGRANPTENGFNFHPSLGTFYLPGSSVKGVVSTYAFEWADYLKGSDGRPDEALHAEVCRRIFGYSDRDGHSSVGTVAFLDALPISSPSLQVDVLTPHQREYHQDASIPGDWNDPVPVPFLSASGGLRLHLALLPGRQCEHTSADLELASQWLLAAASEIGLGAKTAVGFGRFDALSSQEMDRFKSVRATSVVLEPLGAAPGKVQAAMAEQEKQQAREIDQNVMAVEAISDLNRLRAKVDNEALSVESEWSAVALEAAEGKLRNLSDSKKDQRRLKALKKRRRELRGE